MGKFKTLFLPIEKQVCDMEFSIELRRLGVNHNSALWWNVKTKTVHFFTSKEKSSSDWCQAYTSAELDEMLPARIENDSDVLNAGWIFTQKFMIGGGPCYECEWAGGHSEVAITGPNAKAKLLIYIIKNLKAKLKEREPK